MQRLSRTRSSCSLVSMVARATGLVLLANRHHSKVSTNTRSKPSNRGRPAAVRPADSLQVWSIVFDLRALLPLHVFLLPLGAFGAIR